MSLAWTDSAPIIREKVRTFKERIRNDFNAFRLSIGVFSQQDCDNRRRICCLNAWAGEKSDSFSGLCEQTMQPPSMSKTAATRMLRLLYQCLASRRPF